MLMFSFLWNTSGKKHFCVPFLQIYLYFLPLLHFSPFSVALPSEETKKQYQLCSCLLFPLGGSWTMFLEIFAVLSPLWSQKYCCSLWAQLKIQKIQTQRTLHYNTTHYIRSK